VYQHLLTVILHLVKNNFMKFYWSKKYKSWVKYKGYRKTMKHILCDYLYIYKYEDEVPT